MDREPTPPPTPWDPFAQMPPDDVVRSVQPVRPGGSTTPNDRARASRTLAGTVRTATALALAAAIGSGATLVVTGGGSTPIAPAATAGAAAASGSAATAANVTVTAAAARRAESSGAIDPLDPDGLVDTIAAIHGSVVTITAELASPFGRGGTITSTGSGVIVTANGTILTNNHVIDSADAIVVTLEDGTRLDATVLRAEPEADLAVIKVDARRLPAVTIGDSGAIEVGQTAIAIGNPLGEYAGSVTVGIVSGLDRAIDVDEGGWTALHLGGLIQTDAAINSGNSGGALFDGDGQLIGITTAVTNGAQGLAFAIPIAKAASILRKAGVDAA